MFSASVGKYGRLKARKATGDRKVAIADKCGTYTYEIGADGVRMHETCRFHCMLSARGRAWDVREDERGFSCARCDEICVGFSRWSYTDTAACRDLRVNCRREDA